MAKVQNIAKETRKVLKRLEQLPEKVRKKIARQALRAAMKPQYKRTKQEAPKDTGALRRSIKLRAKKRSTVQIGMVIFTELGYGIIMTYGTSKMPPNNWMRRAYIATAWQVRKDTIANIRKGIEKHA